MSETKEITPLRTDSTRGRYSDEEIEAGLTHLARNSGNAKRTAREGPVPETTLRLWRDTHRARYLEIQADVIPTIRAKVAERQAELAEQMADAEEQALQRLVDVLPDLDKRDVGNTLRSLSTSKGITLTQLNTYQAPAKDPNAGSTVGEVFIRLERLGLLAKPIDGQAEDVTDAEVISDEGAKR